MAFNNKASTCTQKRSAGTPAFLRCAFKDFTGERGRATKHAMHLIVAKISPLPSFKHKFMHRYFRLIYNPPPILLRRDLAGDQSAYC